MSFERPSLNSLDTTIRADMQANIDAIQIVGPRTALAGISRAQAGGIHGLHGHAAHNFKQLFPDTSDIAQLERQAGFYGIARRQAFRALGEVVVTGDDATVIPAGTRFGAPSGVEIATTEAGVIAAGSVTLTVQAIEAGAGGNLAQDTGVSFTSPVAGALNTAQIAVPGMALGTDIESRESLSDRVLERMRDVPHGGAAFDYVEQLRALFPRGKAWPEARGPVWDSLLRSLAGELQRFDGRLCDLLEESDPRTTVEALEDWERVLGLPDACFGSGGTVDERRRIVVALLLMQGGQSAAYFVSLAALFGWEIAVEEVFPGLQMDISHFGECEFAVDWSGFDLGPACFGDAALFGESAAPFGWWAYGPATEASRWEFGSTNFGDAFLDFSNRILECLLARFKPAHTRVWTVLNATDVVAALET